MKRVLWNLYAWPVTLLILLSSLVGLGPFDALRTADLLISVPALIGLHFYIWDKKSLSPTIWKFYCYAFFTWEIAYNLLLEPMHTKERFNPLIFVVFVFLLPLYFALFKYAYKYGAIENAN
jgi:uncharacterized membrane protein AbrB (regulator of aidB expression)